MTIRELLNIASQYPQILLILFGVLPVSAIVLGILHGKEKGIFPPWKYLYSIIIYLACIPGMAASVLTAYSIFFVRENLLDANLLIYFLPIISMAATLVFIRKNVSFNDIPGFDRLSGLMILLAVTFGILLAIYKTFIGILFIGHIGMLLTIGLFIFALLKWGSHLLFRGPKEPRKALDSFLNR